ncbi:MAG: type I DNA topoisomerase [bacterium]
MDFPTLARPTIPTDNDISKNYHFLQLFKRAVKLKIMRLVIVESPAKGQTIQKFLGPGYKVLASFGHIRDLPKSELGIDIENNFEPKYIIPIKARKTIKLLKESVQKSESTILATDEDREGEAIAWHLTKALALENPKRIVFHEITKSAIEDALKNPREIDIDLVDSQQARRILDRIVGYKLSPFLWKKVARGLSAGRVQSVAVRLVCEREKEIQKFIPQEYWTVEVRLQRKEVGLLKIEFSAFLVKEDGKVLDKLETKNQKESEKIVKDLTGAEYKIGNIEKKETKRNPLPPFTTSTLQQTAWQKFHWPAKMTMSIAQHLYEAGYITYHRTDSLNLSNLSLETAKNFITKNYGENYYQSRQYKTKSKGAQEAHEAIRPTDPFRKSSSAKATEDRLYELIWRRFVASQMAPAVFDSTKAEIEAKNYGFQANGSILKFDGFLKVYPIKFEKTELPPMEIDEILKLIELIPFQHFTEPPPRYNEASLIKVLEENGIGRPSTYAPTLATIQERNYIEKDEQKRFQPTEIGTTVNDLLVKHFPEIVDIQFTAKMEKDLDDISDNKREWVPVIREFYGPFEKNLEKKYKEIKKEKISVEKTDKICPKCGSPLLLRLGRFGKFYACSAFPKCKYTESLKSNMLGIECPTCKIGKITEKRTRKGKIFYGCDQYPKCDFALWDKPTGEKCPKCQSLLIETKRKQIKCSSKECDYKVESKEKI